MANNSKETERLVAYGIVIALGIVLFFLLFIFPKSLLGGAITEPHPLWHMAVEGLVAILLGGIAFFLWSRYEKEDERKQLEEIKTEINSLSSGLKEIDETRGYALLKANVENSKESILAIGEADLTKSSIEGYLAATIDRLTVQSGLKYRRISHVGANRPFISHLRKILETSAKNHNGDVNEDDVLDGNAAVILTNEFFHANSFVVIDRRFLVVTLSRRGAESILLYTENPRIAEKFSSHFDEIWKNELEKYRPLINPAMLDKYIAHEQDKNVQSVLKQIKSAFDRFDIGYPTLTRRLALKNLSDFGQRIERLAGAGRSFMVEHVNQSWRLLDTFSTYMDGLEDGDTYRTISFPEFWRRISQDARYSNTPEFLEVNRAALERGVNVQRVIILQRGFHIATDPKLDLGSLLKNHVELFEEFGNSNGSGYDFRILVSDNYDNDKKSFLNFAVISKRHTDTQFENIVIQPNTNNGKISETNIYASPNVDSKIKDNVKRIDKICNKHIAQSISRDEYLFFKQSVPAINKLSAEKIQRLFGTAASGHAKPRSV